jgi:hypothetical protein
MLDLKITIVKISNIINSVLGILLVMVVVPAMAQQTKMVGGTEMFPTKTLSRTP